MNQQAMMRQLRQMMATQKEINETVFTATCGPVEGKMYGSKEGFEVKIQDGFVIEDADDKELLEDAVKSVVNKLLDDINKTTEEKMAKYKALTGMF